MKTTIRLSKLLFEKYPNSVKKLVEIFDKNKIPFEEIENLQEALPKLDVLYMTRVQRERLP